jgi:hypothetical protein
MLKKLPKLLALVGTGATAIAVVAAFLIEGYSLHAFFRYDYMWMEYVVLPLLMVGVPTGFIGNIWWARQLEPSTRITTGCSLFLICGSMMFFPHLNIHGAGGLLVLTFFPVLLLGVILLVMGLAGRTPR